MIYDGEFGYFLDKEDISKYKYLFEGESLKYTYDLKKCIVLLHDYDININNCQFDTSIAAYLCDYEVKDDISFVANAMGYDVDKFEDVYGTIKRPIDVSDEKLHECVISKAKFIYDSIDELKNKLLNMMKKNYFMILK